SLGLSLTTDFPCYQLPQLQQIAAMILSYTLLFVKLGASYGQDDRLRAQTIATPTVATTYGLRLGNSTDYWTLSTAHWAT
ncbi:hypothetical protein BOX15_Mlig019070g4, partial [Macrostomum lignano]